MLKQCLVSQLHTNYTTKKLLHRCFTFSWPHSKISWLFQHQSTNSGLFVARKIKRWICRTFQAQWDSEIKLKSYTNIGYNKLYSVDWHRGRCWEDIGQRRDVLQQQQHAEMCCHSVKTHRQRRTHISPANDVIFYMEIFNMVAAKKKM